MALFDHFMKYPEAGIKMSVFGKMIVNAGFKKEQLAGHLLASLTDREARDYYRYRLK